MMRATYLGRVWYAVEAPGWLMLVPTEPLVEHGVCDERCIAFRVANDVRIPSHANDHTPTQA